MPGERGRPKYNKAVCRTDYIGFTDVAATDAAVEARNTRLGPTWSSPTCRLILLRRKQCSHAVAVSMVVNQLCFHLQMPTERWVSAGDLDGISMRKELGSAL